MNDSTSLIGFIIGVAGIIASFVFYVRSKEKPKPIWRAANLPLIGGNSPLLPADVEVIYRGAKVQSLAKSYVAFWNAGRKTILGSDVVPSDPIRFTVVAPNMEILNARIIRRTREVDQAELLFNEREVQITFDFLDPKDGITLEVIHTGVGKQLTSAGTIRGIPRGIRQVGKPPRFAEFLGEVFGGKKKDDFVPANFQKATIGCKITSAFTLFVFLALPISFGVGGFQTLTTHSVHTRTPLSYKDYLRTFHYQSEASSSGTLDKVFSISILVFSFLMLTIGIMAIIRLWRYQTPTKLALTTEDVSDRQ